MSHVLFISDLHLSPDTPEIVQQFQPFLTSKHVMQADALYILGDLFDAWIGDDDPSPFAARISGWLQQAGENTHLYFQHGNRDFLLGEDFARAANLVLLAEEHVMQIAGKPVLLLHGDQLCTDDKDYQHVRTLLRSPQFHAQIMSMSIPDRIRKAAEIRQMSGEAIARKSADIMDVTQEAVETTMRKHGVLRLIHGHTHRPDTHRFKLDGKPAERIVLADWKASGSSALLIDTNSGEARTIAI